MDVPENAPQHCPGTESEEAGKADSCQGCPNREICASSTPRAPDQALPDIRHRLESVKHVIIVLSGKGGVGKTSVCSQLAWTLAEDKNVEVGVLDVDICGPSVPIALGCQGNQVHISQSGLSPVYPEENLAVMSVAFALERSDSAVIWRGPKKNGMIKSFLKDTDWGDLDYLIIDTPPGTSDEHISLIDYLRPTHSSVHSLIVTTPQEVALSDVRKELDFTRKVNLNVIGIVENMTHFVCPKCHKSTDVFPGTTGGAESLTETYKVPVIARIPLDPRIGEAMDNGESVSRALPNSPTSTAYLDLAQRVKTLLPPTQMDE
jgi:Mrp family chromosome partitioning ATPase